MLMGALECFAVLIFSSTERISSLTSLLLNQGRNWKKSLMDKSCQKGKIIAILSFWFPTREEGIVKSQKALSKFLKFKAGVDSSLLTKTSSKKEIWWFIKGTLLATNSCKIMKTLIKLSFWKWLKVTKEESRRQKKFRSQRGLLE